MRAADVLSTSTQCNVTWFLNMPISITTYRNSPSRQRIVTDVYAPGIKLYLEETASAPLGGCVGISATFAAGFLFSSGLILLSLYGVDMVGRQNIFGYSFVGTGSQYQLMGPPGVCTLAPRLLACLRACMRACR
jgi:hypothetical protein